MKLMDAAAVNALPEPLRRYIHDLETMCDPAGLVLENYALRSQAAAVEAMYLSQTTRSDTLTAADLTAAEALLADPDAEDCERFVSRYGRALLDAARSHESERVKGLVEALREIEAIALPAARDVTHASEVIALLARGRVIARSALSAIPGEAVLAGEGETGLAPSETDSD